MEEPPGEEALPSSSSSAGNAAERAAWDAASGEQEVICERRSVEAVVAAATFVSRLPRADLKWGVGVGRKC